MHDLDKNTFQVSVETSPAFLALGQDPEPAVVWVNFGHEGPEVGSREMRFDSLQDAVDVVKIGGIVRIDAHSAVTSTSGTFLISKPMTIEAIDGTVTITGL